MSPTSIEAFLGGIKSFFSIWQLCILQFSPFYAAFLVAVYLLLGTKDLKTNFLTMQLAGLGLAAGFSVIFALAGSPGISAGAEILRSLRGLRFASGLFILAAGLLMIALSFMQGFAMRAMLPAFLSPFIGAALAVAYSPCIPPVLSQIYSFAGEPGNSPKGFLLLFLYGLGMCASATLVAGVVMAAWRMKKRSWGWMAPAFAAAFFMLIGIMLVAGWMLAYKRFLVNLI